MARSLDPATQRSPRSAPALLSRPRPDRVLSPPRRPAHCRELDRSAESAELRRRAWVPNGLASETWDSTRRHRNHLRRTNPFRPASRFPRLRRSPPPFPPADRAAALQLIREDIGDCTRCALHKGRNKIVFADGSPNARLMFVGEGPGADEDAQGLPFVGRAGQLLNNMITAMGLKREEVYIANVVKCRPPGNRTPEPDEANTCSPFLFRQIDVVRPEVIVALGATAATYLLGQRQPLAGLRGRVHSFRGMQADRHLSSGIPAARSRARRRKPGPTCRSPCANWD